MDRCFRLSILCGSLGSVSVLCAWQILWGQSLRLMFCVDPLGSASQAHVLWGSFVISVSGPVCYVDLLGSETQALISDMFGSSGSGSVYLVDPLGQWHGLRLTFWILWGLWLGQHAVWTLWGYE